MFQYDNPSMHCTTSIKKGASQFDLEEPDGPAGNPDLQPSNTKTWATCERGLVAQHKRSTDAIVAE